jgi:glycosyltransferase involved in cell wall biosynthesis
MSIFVLTNNLNMTEDGGIAKFINLLSLELKNCVIVNFSIKSPINLFDGSNIKYIDVSRLNTIDLIRFLWNNRDSIFYIQGIFGFRHVILPLLVSNKTVISPHGMLQEGALKKKKKLKLIYFNLIKCLLLFKNCHFIVSDNLEKKDVHFFLGNSKTSIIPLPVEYFEITRYNKKKCLGQLNLVYFSVISEKKNLLFLLEVLKKVRGSVKLTIYGPIKDENYWLRCMGIINESDLLKDSVSYKGPVFFQDYQTLIEEYDYFVLPTQGENFGYAILENLGCGLPVLISDKTPWLFDGDSKMFSLPLEDNVIWVNTLEELVRQTDEDYKLASTSARVYYENYIKKSLEVGLYSNFFTNF